MYLTIPWKLDVIGLNKSKLLLRHHSDVRQITGLNPLTTKVAHNIKTSQLICSGNQLTGFYMMGNLGRYVKRFLYIRAEKKWVNHVYDVIPALTLPTFSKTRDIFKYLFFTFPLCCMLDVVFDTE